MPALAPDRRLPRIRVMPGGHLVIALTILLGVLAAHTGQNVLQALVAALLAFQVVSGFRSFVGLRGLELEVEAPARLAAGEEGRLRIRLRNGKRRLASHSLEVDVRMDPDDVVGVATAFVGRLRASEPVNLDLPVRARRRGVARLVEVRVASAYPCDLFRRVLRYPLDLELLVRPARRELRAPERGAAHAQAARARRADPLGDELRGVRAYRPGDPPKSIHWRTSARAGALVVRDDEARRRVPWTILVAPDPRDVAEIEAELERAAALCRAAVQEGPGGTLCLAGAATPLPLEGRRRLEVALDALARHVPTDRAPPPAPAPVRVFLVGRLARAPVGARSAERADASWERARSAALVEPRP